MYNKDFEQQDTFFFFGLFVTKRKTDRDSSVEDVSISITAVVQDGTQSLAALIQQEGLLQVYQVLTTGLVVTAQNMLHQCLFLEDTQSRLALITHPVLLVVSPLQYLNLSPL